MAETAPEINPRALSNFAGGLPPAFAGTHIASSVDGRFRGGISAPEPETHLAPLHIRAVRVTDASYGNRVRLGIVEMMREWWRWRTPMRGEIFRRDFKDYETIPRMMQAPRRLDRLVPSRRVYYEAPMYGRDTTVGDPIYRGSTVRDWRDTALPAAAAKIRSRRGGRFR